MSSLRFRGRFAASAVAIGVLGTVWSTPAHAQVCAGLPAASHQVVSLVAGGRQDQPPSTDLQYIGISYSRSAGERLTLSGSVQIPMLFPTSTFRRLAVELAVALPHTFGPGCPVLTGGYSASSGTLDASPHLSVGYGFGRVRRQSTDEADHSSFTFCAVPGVLLDRMPDHWPDETGSARIRFAADVGFLISLTPHLYIGAEYRRAFLDGGGTSLEAGLGWNF